MRVPFSWLCEYCDPGLSAEEVADLLSMRAVEVERVSTVGPPSPEGFVVGRVLAAEPHPDADRLSVCTVDAGDGDRTIVCGAPNVAAGQTVAVALPGAVMPGGEKLDKAKLRGVESAGMILAEDELELGDDHDGIMVLGDLPFAPGTPLTEVIPVTEQVLELDLNPNRSDCLGVYAVAREVHAITGSPLAAAPWESDAEATGAGSVYDLASVRVEVPDLCPRFTARAFTEVTTGPSPLWLRARLIAAGQRPISNIVDVTNYVMLMTAQPIHAFDLDRVPEGELIVRLAADGERMTTLDGVERALDSETVLVCDREQPTGIAGVMGGQVSEVSDETTRVLLEVANWNGPNILRTSNALGLRSEASARFEKQLHPELAIRAQRVASRLIVELAGADLVPGTIDEAVEPPPPHRIALHGARAEALLGVAIPRDEAAEHLTRLGFNVEAQGDEDLTVEVTPERHFDVAREVDLIEEVARLHGLDRLPRTLPAHGQRRGELSREQRLRRDVEDALADLGFDQTIGWALVSPALADRLRLAADDPRRTASVPLANPLSEDGSVMRTTLIGSLLDAARYNLARGAESVALYESGRAYLAEAAPAAGGTAAGAFPGRTPAPDREPLRLAALLVGPLAPAGWRGAEGAGDLFALKGVLETLAEGLGAEVRLEPATEPFLHPGRAAAVAIGGAQAGWIGELHPAVAADWDLPGGTAFELDVAPLFAEARRGEALYEDVTTHPAVLQDLAVVVAEDVPAERVVATVRDAGGELLRSVGIFDLYRGEQVGEGQKSLALRLEFRAPDRTLTDEEVAGHRKAIAGALESIGGTLRV
jgi:phenylalanyl-tRNA synthetase beta chain